jgi:hypothetical protein
MVGRGRGPHRRRERNLRGPGFRNPEAEPDLGRGRARRGGGDARLGVGPSLGWPRLARRQRGRALALAPGEVLLRDVQVSYRSGRLLSMTSLKWRPGDGPEIPLQASRLRPDPLDLVARRLAIQRAATGRQLRGARGPTSPKFGSAYHASRGGCTGPDARDGRSASRGLRRVGVPEPPLQVRDQDRPGPPRPWPGVPLRPPRRRRRAAGRAGVARAPARVRPRSGPAAGS